MRTAPPIFREDPTRHVTLVAQTQAVERAIQIMHTHHLIDQGAAMSSEEHRAHETQNKIWKLYGKSSFRCINVTGWFHCWATR